MCFVAVGVGAVLRCGGVAMMDALRQWLFSVVVISMLVSLVERWVPQGALGRITQFIGGLLLLLTILRPVAALKGVTWNWELSSYQSDIAALEESLSQSQQMAWEVGIQESTQAYILEKANALGVACNVEVEVETGADGVPYPVAVQLDVPYHQALGTYIAQTLGIGEEGQRWDETT